QDVLVGEDHVRDGRRADARGERQDVVPDAPVVVRDGRALFVCGEGLGEQLAGALLALAAASRAGTVYRLAVAALLLVPRVVVVVGVFGFGGDHLAVQAPERTAQVAPRLGVLSAR